jgi:hypothetical protein
MSINFYLLQITPKLLESIKNDETLLKRILKTSLPHHGFSNLKDFKSLYAGQGIFSVEDFIEKNPYIDALEPELKKEALKRVKKIFRKNANYDNVLALDKAWHGIHFLLSGEVWRGESLMASVLMGGTEIGDESVNTGYGVPRYHTPGEVGKISENLPSLEELEKSYEPEKMTAADIYAFNAGDAAEEWIYLSRFYRQMFDYFRGAAKRGNAMLLFAA